MKGVRVAERAPSEWLALWGRDPEATLFHHPQWMEAIARAYPRFEPRYLVWESDGRVAGLLPMIRYRKLGLEQLLSLPFGTYGGPVIDPEADPKAAAGLCEGFAERTRRPNVLRFEMTLFTEQPGRIEGADRVLGSNRESTHTHVIDLRDGFETLWSTRYDKETRTCVRKAEREGVTAGKESGAEPIRLLAELHAAQGRSWEGYRPHTEESLGAVIATLGDEAELWVARRGGEPLAAVLALGMGGREVFPWVSGSRSEARPVRAMHLLYDRMLRSACEDGRVRWNFGGSAGNPGIEAFKVSFGAVASPVVRYFGEAAWSRWRRRS